MDSIFRNGCNTHLVLKASDIDKYLSASDIDKLRKVLLKIEKGRESDGKTACNSYYICNHDEPYADNVINVILDGEHKKVIANLTEDNLELFVGNFVKLHDWGFDPIVAKVYESVMYAVAYFITKIDIRFVLCSETNLEAICKFLKKDKDEILYSLDKFVEEKSDKIDEKYAECVSYIRCVDRHIVNAALVESLVYCQSALNIKCVNQNNANSNELGGKL